MLELNLPPASLNIRKEQGKDYVFDRLRKQFVRLTPEEYVRQTFVAYLLAEKNYPEGLLANEVGISLGKVSKRCDTVLYGKQLRPQMIIEYKAPDVAISQKTFDQIARYNLVLKVPYLIVSNGLQHYCCHIDRVQGGYMFLQDIPEYGEIITSNPNS